MRVGTRTFTERSAWDRLWQHARTGYTDKGNDFAGALSPRLDASKDTHCQSIKEK